MVNSSIYIFGAFDNGYTQYPDNYAKEIYQNFFAQARSKSQIVIHRDKELMYYGYIRQLDKYSQYIGFCVLLNGMMLTNVSNLFTVFENAIAEMVSRGDIIAFNEQGDIVSTTNSLANKLQEVNAVIAIIRNGIDGMDSYTKSLPPVNYSISNTEKKVFAYSDSNDTIIDASYRYAYTYVAKDKGYNTASLSGYKGIIRKLHKEKDELFSEYGKLKTQYDKLNKQKKQYKNVIILCLIVVFCGIGLFFLNDTLNSTQQTLEQSQNENVQKGKTIQKLNSDITVLNGNISNLESSLSLEQSKREEAETELNTLKNIYMEQQPLFIKSTSFNFNSGYLSFEYYGYYEKTVTLGVRAFDGNYSYSNSTTFNVEKGHHSSSIYLSSYLSSSRWYSFELLIGNKIIGGDRH